MALWGAFCELGISFVSPELVQEAAANYLIASMNRAVKEECEAQETGFVSVDPSGDGKVAAIAADAVALNRLKAGVTERLAHLLNGRVTLGVPAGSLTDVGILNGRGPKIPIKLSLEGSADVTFQTTFESAGVNQSCHRIVMQITSSACSQSRRFELQVQESTSTVLAETVVVGEVPDVALDSR